MIKIFDSFPQKCRHILLRLFRKHTRMFDFYMVFAARVLLNSAYCAFDPCSILLIHAHNRILIVVLLIPSLVVSLGLLEQGILRPWPEQHIINHFTQSILIDVHYYSSRLEEMSA